MKSERPKVIFKLAEKEMVRRVTETALKINCDPIGIVVGYQKERVMDAIPDNDNISFIEQQEQKGTGHAVMVCSDLFAEFAGDLLILCGDIPLLSRETLDNLINTHRKNEAACTVLTIKLTEPASYGRIIRDKNDRIERIVEFKDATSKEKEVNEINTGIYCFDSKLLFTALKKIDNDNKQQEYYLTDTLAILNSMGKKVIGLVTDNKAEVTGINSQRELAELEISYYAKIKDHWLANGVNIENPSSVIIGEDVLIDPDVDIGNGVIIKGKSKIAKGAVIGAYCYLDNAVIGRNAMLEGYNIVVNNKVSDNCRLKFQEKRNNE